jgi:hypothetical protein
MTQDHDSLLGIFDMEMEDGVEATPRPRDFQRHAEDTDVEPYETPVVLKKPKRRAQQVVEDSDAEAQLDVDGEKEREATAHSGLLTSASVIKIDS